MRRLALVLGIVGAAGGAFASYGMFEAVRRQCEDFDKVEHLVATGALVRQKNGALLWKTDDEEILPYSGSAPDRRPNPDRGSIFAHHPRGRVLLPWGGVMLVAWIIAGFLTR